MYRSILMLVSFLTLVSTSEASTRQWSLGAHLGTWKPIGGGADLGNLGPVLSLDGGYSVHDWASIHFGIRYGWTRPGTLNPNESAGFTFRSETDLYTRVWQPYLTIVTYLADEGRWKPWVSAGIGVTRWDIRDPGESGWSPWPSGSGIRVRSEGGALVDGHGVHLTTTLGVGVNYAIDDAWALDWGICFHSLLDQRVDFVGLSGVLEAPAVDANDALVEASMGIRYSFGTHRSQGTEPTQDVQSRPQRGHQASTTSTEANDDLSQFVQQNELSPTSPPEQIRPPTVEVSQLDGDHDGVSDPLDQCPQTPAGVQVDEFGCPLVEAIPDTLILQGVHFAASSSGLNSSAKRLLDDVVESLKVWTSVRVAIVGFTDDRGSLQENLRLSQERARNVRLYLMNHGIAPHRIQIDARGASEPLGSNDTRSGRVLNRRVEIRKIEQ